MKQHLYFLLAGLLSALCAHTQDTLQTGISRDSSIRTTLVQGYKYPRLIYTANGEEIGQREIVHRLTLYPSTFDELQQYHDAKTGTFVWLGVMLAGITGSAIEKAQNDVGGTGAFTCVVLTAVVCEFISAAKAQRHMRQAVRIYNKRFIP